MRRISYQLGKIFPNAKTHKSDSLEDITIQNFKFRPIISHKVTYAYNPVKVLSD